jgi:hypothetical protein
MKNYFHLCENFNKLMNLHKSLSLICTSLVVLLVSGCKKEEGEGGTSTITGKIIVHDFDQGFQNPTPKLIYPASDEKAYIIYGEDKTAYDDDYNTSYDGTYEFKHLQKGKYKIFAYSKDSTGAKVGLVNFDAPKIPVIVNVEITSNGSTVTVPDIIILDNNQN